MYDEKTSNSTDRNLMLEYIETGGINSHEKLSQVIIT